MSFLGPISLGLWAWCAVGAAALAVGAYIIKMRRRRFEVPFSQLWKRVLEILRREESYFPDGKSVWLKGTPYRGEGPLLGQKGKYELVVVPTPADQVSLLKTHFGLSIERTQRWNVIAEYPIAVTSHAPNPDLAKAWVEMVSSPGGQKILSAAGFHAAAASR